MDETVKKRLARIYELNTLATKGPLTAAQKAELKKLQDEQTNWEIYNPGLKGDVQTYQESLKAPAAQLGNEKLLKKDMEDKAAGEAAAERATTPKPVVLGAPTGDVDERTAYANKVYQDAIASGIDTRTASLMADEAWRNWKQPEAAPDPSEVYGGLKDWERAPDPSIEYPKGDWERAPDPSIEYPKGEPYGLPSGEAAAGSGGAAHHKVPGKGDLPEHEVGPEKPSFAETAKRLGLGALDMLEAIGKQRGKIDKPTSLDLRYQAQIEKEQKEYMEKLAQKAADEEEKRKARLAQSERTWASSEAALDRENARTIAAMNKAARDAAAAQTVGLVPD